MARPRKEGLDYFPMNVEMNDDFKALEELHGNDGFSWLVKFWQAAYKKSNGFISLDGIHGVIRAKTSRISPEKQREIIKHCLEIGLLFEKNGLFSSVGIQKRIQRVMSERKKDRSRGTKNELSDGKLPENTPKTSGKGGKVKGNRNKKEIENKRINLIKFHDYVFLTQDEYDRMVKMWGKHFTDCAIAEYDRKYPNSRAIQKHKDHNRGIQDYVHRGYICAEKTPNPEKPNEKKKDDAPIQVATPEDVENEFKSIREKFSKNSPGSIGEVLSDMKF